MPQGKKIVFGDNEPDSQQRKRKAEEAFAESAPSPKPQAIRKSKSNKVVNFHDDNATDNDHKQSNSNDSRNGSSQANAGKLKLRAQALSSTRQSLPIYQHANEIKTKVGANDVLLLVGETGSGKSTQVPQFLLNEGFTKRKSGKNSVKAGGCIAITQPRRVAAISLARRVAEEIGTPLGNSSPASLVGYSVRFDTSTGPSTRIKFLTDGMLLQELLRDPWLKEYSVVVVDEVHERGLNVDLVMGFLRWIVEGRNENDGRGGVPLKIVVMSATADMKLIEGFFSPEKETGALLNGGSTKDEDEFNGFSDDDHTLNSKPNGAIKVSTPTTPIRLTSCFIKGRQYPVQINYTSQPVSSSWDAALERIVQIHQHTPLPGDILVFLPGQEAIDSLESMCNNYASTLIQQSKQKGAPKIPKLLILPLFAALPTAAQQRVFEQTPPFTRKIILSTNIAETSVTVPGIRHVIDTGKRKARFFRPSLNLDTLLVKPISRSSAQQRAGRAGREAPGSCWRLYTEKTFYELEADTEPEILRCDLSQLVLTLKAHHVDDILAFPLLTQPPVKALERALLHLLQLKALDAKTGHITTLGRKMSTLPLPANLARILLASIEPRYNCLNEIIDIVSGLSVENIWLPIHNKAPTQPDQTDHKINTNDNDNDSSSEQTNPIESARRTLYRRSGDHLTLQAAIHSYANENTDRKAWCRKHGVSHRAMTAAMDVRKQLTNLMRTTSASPKPKPNEPEPTHETTRSNGQHTPSDPLDTRILRCLLTGLHTNTARLQPHIDVQSNRTAGGANGPYRTYYSSKPLQIHPGSVLFGREKSTRAADIVFSEFVFTARPYARGVSEVRGEWIEAVMREVEG